MFGCGVVTVQTGSGVNTFTGSEVNTLLLLTCSEIISRKSELGLSHKPDVGL